MPIPWNREIAANYWQRRQFTLLHSGANAVTRIANNLQSIANRRDAYQGTLAALQAAAPREEPQAAFTNTQQSLELWVKTLSWSHCEDCGSVMCEKLLPSFNKSKKSNSSVKCHCKDDKYIVPNIADIPPELRCLEPHHVKALRPFDVDTGTYKRMQYGYRKKTCTLRFTCSKASVNAKIAALPSEEDRLICMRALQFLLASPNSSYKKFFDIRNDLVTQGKEPNIFDVYKWVGIECAIWPNIYPFTSWCESIHDGGEHRRSSKISFIAKCFSPLLDYSLNFELLQFVFDRWLYKTVTGAINSCCLNRTEDALSSASYALQEKPFSIGYWDWQHRYLIDAVRLFGYPSLFITISPSDWSFPLPAWLDDISRRSGYGATQMPCFETYHFMHVLERIVRGYLCGSNDCNWRNHVFSYNRTASKNIQAYFYRFEFQKRGTVHIHFLVWLKQPRYIDLQRLRGEIPLGNSLLLYHVNKYQTANRSSLPIHDAATTVRQLHNREEIVLSHSAESFGNGLRWYIDTVLCTLKSSMDVQATNGKGMILKYVASYVSKAHESFHSDALYCRSLSPSTTAIRYSMALDIAEPEMWALLSSKKLSWTNASRKQCALPTTIEKARNWSKLGKYYARAAQCENMSLLQWLHSFDETAAIPTRYAPRKVVLVGVKHVSFFNPVYFFQYLLCNFPHRDLASISPPEDTNLPEQILYFNKAAALLRDKFTNAADFCAEIETEGHKQYFLDTLQSYITSLINMNNLYRRQLLPSLTSSQTDASLDSISPLRGSQLLFFTYFTQIIEARERDILSDGMETTEDVDWKKFPLIVGRPGSGKTFTVERCIEHASHSDLAVCVALPTGVLACTYRAKYEESVTCDAVHSLFLVQSHHSTTPEVNWLLSQYDIIFIDEISQISVTIFHHIIATLEKLDRRPLLVLCGDFAQQQPIATVNSRTRQVPNILSCHHCMSYTQKFTMTQQYRVQDQELLNFLHHIRYAPPTEEMLQHLCEGRTLSPSSEITAAIYSKLQLHPDALIITMTRKGASFINDVIIQHLFTTRPLALIVMDNEQLVPLHIGMRLMLTQNINKSIGFVNGQIVTISALPGNTIVASHPRGAIINIFPVTRLINDIPTTLYPCLPGYATTISKIQGQTLEKVITWLDAPTTPAGTAYVALSRVRKLSDLFFMTPVSTTQFSAASYKL